MSEFFYKPLKTCSEIRGLRISEAKLKYLNPKIVT